jgi:hypothetical protein
VFSEEADTFNLVTLLMWLLPLLVTTLSLLDISLFYLYNKKLHPWSTILAEEKTRVENNKNCLSRCWLWICSCLVREDDFLYLGKIKVDIFAVKAKGKVKASGNLDNTRKSEEPTDANQVEAEEVEVIAKDEEDAVTDGKVEAIDEFCTDDVYNLENKKTKSVETQTLETGPLPNTPSKAGFYYYNLCYDDFSD